MEGFERLGRWWLPGLAVLVLGTGCDSGAGFYSSDGSDSLQPEGDVLHGEDIEEVSPAEDLGEEDTRVSEDVWVPEPDLPAPISCSRTLDDALGPYYLEGAPFLYDLAGPDEPGQRILIKGFVRNEDCEGIPDAVLDIWQTDADGNYPAPEEGYRLRGRVKSGENGYYAFETILPGFYEDRPRHLHLKGSGPDHLDLTTQLYFRDDPFLWPNDSCAPPTCHSDDPKRILTLIALGTGDESILVGDFNLVLTSQ